MLLLITVTYLIIENQLILKTTYPNTSLNTVILELRSAHS